MMVLGAARVCCALCYAGDTPVRDFDWKSWLTRKQDRAQDLCSAIWRATTSIRPWHAGALFLATSLFASAEGSTPCSNCPQTLPIPAGRFWMGSPANEPERESWQAGTESPRHEVVIPHAFEMGRFAVTVAEFAAFVTATGYRMDGSCHVFDGRDWTPRSDISWRAPGFAQTGDHPAVCVGWHDAIAYVAWLNAGAGGSGYRLPSEAEREYAARAGPSTPFWWGPTISPSEANYDHREVYAGTTTRAPYRGGTVPVERYAPNGFGLYQVHGNVWEWTADCYVDTYADKTPDLRLDGATPQTDRGCDRRSLRGGAFNRRPTTLRAAYRTGLDPNFRGHSIGFRVARSLAAPPPNLKK